jgi:hypothetical protein
VAHLLAMLEVALANLAVALVVVTKAPLRELVAVV